MHELLKGAATDKLQIMLRGIVFTVCQIIVDNTVHPDIKGCGRHIIIIRGMRSAQKSVHLLIEKDVDGAKADMYKATLE